MIKTHQPTWRRPPVLAAIVVLALLSGVTFWKQRGAGTNPPLAHPLTEQGRAGSDSAYLGTDGKSRATFSQPAPTGQEAVRDILAMRNQSRAELAQRNARSKDALLTAYRSETANPAWAEPAERELQRLAMDPAVAAAVKAEDVEIDCKRSVCRTSARFSSSGQADDWSMMYMASTGGVVRNSVVSRTQNADGSVVVEVYSAAK